MNRRTFLKSSALAAGAGLLSRSSSPAWAQPLGANDAVRVAVIGINNKGAGHIKQLKKIPGARIVALCDVDPAVLAREVESLKQDKVNVFATTDARRLMDRPDIDAIVIATSNHWHALLTAWGCQAGKDVYVEKPVSHSVWEGRKMVEAAARYGRVVQAGTQTRSDRGILEFIPYLRAGHLGKVHSIHALFYKERESIGNRLPRYPKGLDYDLYSGPAPMEPLVRNELHYDWHWFWSTGNGDLGNIGIHVFDLARWLAGHESPPRRVLSLGGRFVIEDSGETPNSQLTIFDYPDVPIVLENRGLPSRPGSDTMDQVHGLRSGVIVKCDGGYFAGHRGGWVYDHDGRRMKAFPGDGGGGHMPNFIEAVRNRRPQDLAAPIEVGHASTSAPLMGNISYRLGRRGTLADARNALADQPFAREHLERFQKHLAAHGVNSEQPRLTLGPWIEVDREGDGISQVQNGDSAGLDRARFLLKETQRPPYVIPERV
ncbi:MAG: Gfo/Idh/MocA family oxidoreductase [Opitutaceae bacterium]